MRPRIDTHHEPGDAHLRSGDFFEHRHPSPDPMRKARRCNTVAEKPSRVTGNLRIHGVIKAITFEAEESGQSFVMGMQRASLTANTKITRKDTRSGFLIGRRGFEGWW
jgi:polyisoprenoid-binding protein YceI